MPIFEPAGDWAWTLGTGFDSRKDERMPLWLNPCSSDSLNSLSGHRTTTCGTPGLSHSEKTSRHEMYIENIAPSGALSVCVISWAAYEVTLDEYYGRNRIYAH